MTEAMYVDAVMARPPVMQWVADEVKKKEAVEATAKATLSRLVSIFPWPFATGHASRLTVAGDSEYTLKGSADNAASIINIRYGEGKKLLEKWDENAYDELISASASSNDDGSTSGTLITSTPWLWIPYGEENTFPRVKIHGTPTSVQTMYYRFYKKNLQFDIWPEQWSLVLILNIEADLFAGGAPFSSEHEYRSDPGYFTRAAAEILNDMIGQYERKGGEDSPAPLGRDIRARFGRRSDMSGY